ncbi:SDR family NAD(P)-dependent oxidoreductase [Salinigranum sp. GCM10025319]|uniref:SDR family NAD(P)-dependent oxidoreductase n=1 Tax=Salinigranum sp. GCM10025319 TaxID=3252687 RepID=UPI00361A818A
MYERTLLADKTAIVTGGGRNIGKGIAELLAAHGASVAVNDIDADRAESLVASLPDEMGQSHRAIPCDATDSEDVEAAVQGLRDEWDTLDVLVNNVGYSANKGILETSVEDWHTVLDLTLTSGFLWTREAAPVMAETGGGSIINLASILGRYGQRGMLAYCAAKGGVVNMTRALAHDLAEHDIRVNSISPGLAGDRVGHEGGAEERDTSRILLGRLGTPEDIGSATVFLASDAGSYITGADLAVDGGMGGFQSSSDE